MPTVACIGGGVIGRSWAVAFAAGGATVKLHDVSASNLSRAREFAAGSLADLARHGLCDDSDRALARMSFLHELDAAVAGVEYVQESIAEDLDLKRKLFVELDRLTASEAILASSTSTIPASEFAGLLAGCGRCVVAHPINPPHLIPVVEVCAAPFTHPETVRKTVELLRSIGREPVVVRKEIFGFIVNRLQLALLREALYLVGEGYCSALDLDRAVRRSLGLRWASIGPLEAGHLNADAGYDEYMKKFEPAMKSLIADLKTHYEWTEADVRKIADELSGRVPLAAIPSGQAARDRGLLELLQFLRAAGDQGAAAAGRKTPASSIDV